MRSAVLALVPLLLACASSTRQPDAGEVDGERETPPHDAAPLRDAGPDAEAPSLPTDAAAGEAPPPAPDAVATTPDALAAHDADVADASPADASPADAGPLQLTSTGFLMKGGDSIFPASASYPMDQSPPFEWSGAPAATKSLALTFVDESNGATKWVLWDIPANLTGLPGNISKAVNPPEVPGSSQRGSLGRTGYSGPGVPGPPLHVYQFVLWALDVQKLQNTDGLSTIDLRTKLLPAHALAQSAPLVAKGQEGGP